MLAVASIKGKSISTEGTLHSNGVNPGSLHTVDAGCYPRPVVRSIAPPNIITHPRTITTYECSGFDEALDHIRQNYMCVAIETGVITKEVYRYSHNSLAKRNFTNHTKCKMMCVCELDGFQCEAEDKMKGDVPCPDGYIWNHDECHCEAVCVDGGRSTGMGRGITVGILVLALCIEIVIILIIATAVYICRQNRPFPRRHQSPRRQANNNNRRNYNGTSEKENLKVTSFQVLTRCTFSMINKNDMPCKPRPVVKEFVPVKDTATQHTTTVLECSGYTGSMIQRHLKCVPIKRKSVVIKYSIDMDRNDKRKYQTYNHTKCDMKCVCDHDGYDCTNKPPFEIPCPTEMAWDWGLCKCAPSASACASVNPSKSESSISIGVFIISLIGELFALFVLFLFVKHYKRSWCSYPSHSSSASDVTDSPDQNEATRLCDKAAGKRETHQSISGTLLENDYDNQNGYR